MKSLKEKLKTDVKIYDWKDKNKWISAYLAPTISKHNGEYYKKFTDEEIIKDAEFRASAFNPEIDITVYECIPRKIKYDIEKRIGFKP